MLKTIAAVACAVSCSGPLHAETQYADVVEAFAEAMEEKYVFPDVGKQCAALLRQNLKSGKYDGLDGEALAVSVHDELREVTKDRHFGIKYNPPTPGATKPQPAGGYGQPVNHGFRKVEILTGNIGYLDFRFFDGSEDTKDTVDAAMGFLRDSDAVIVDMRQNGGGAPQMVQYICSYFFGDDPVHLNSIYDRTSDSTEEFWTLADLPGDRFDKVPVYVLTSAMTFSGAEEFSYNLQTRDRATLVGETTGGGAHPVMGIEVGEGFSIGVPFARAINPVTGTNWEGTGVTPDIACPADEALDMAQMLVLDELSESASGHQANRLAWAADFLRSKIVPVKVDNETLKKYAGSYGPRQLTFRDGTLYYSREGNPERPLNALSNDTFMIEGVDFFKLKFVSDNKGKIKSILGSYSQGHTDVSMRDED